MAPFGASRAGLMSVTRDDIPDSVVSRPDDDRSFDSENTFGVRIETSQEWEDFGGRLSQNISGQTRAYLYRVSDGQLMGDLDISGLSALDTFVISDVNLAANEQYNFVVDAEGSTFTQGSFENSVYPYTSSDGNLEIVNGAQGETGTPGGDDAINILEAGNIGF